MTAAYDPAEWGEDVPLPPEPDPYDEYDDADPGPFPDPQPIGRREVDEVIPAVIPRPAAERAAMLARWEAARRVHVAAQPEGGRLFERLGAEFDPRARHVGCDGDPESGERGCGKPPGEACEHPRGRFAPGFVHPSRLRSERLMFGIDETTVSV